MSLAEALPDPESFVTEARSVIAANVRAELGRRRVSQTALAKHLSVSQPWVSRRVSGEVAFDTDDLIRIAQALGCDLGDLLDGARSRWFPALALVETPPDEQLALDLDHDRRPLPALV